jgi:aryl-alcohol dehydrogenase-like predicted oxidoreductase
MGKAGAYGASSDDEGIAAIHAAIERGITFIDTGDFYSMGENEMLVGRAIQGRRDKVTLSVKFGAMRDPAGAFIGLDTRPVAVKSSCAYSLKRLGVDVIDIYRPARLDPNVPIEDTIGAIADLIKAGYVRQIGLSEVGVETIRRAHAVHPIADLQIEYAISTRGPEEKIFPVLHELGIGATLYGVLSRGLLTGSPMKAGDYRAHLPRFSGANAALVEKLRDFAGKVGQTPAQVCVGWVMAKEPKLMPLIGARKPSQLDVFDAKPLTPEQVSELERLLPKDAFSGPRYPQPMMAHLDSEK